ncbi:MAG TPA: neutral zinc metallopeptidase [Kofleriaceae bacterium]
MRWDRNYNSSNIEDRRGQGGVGLGGGGVPIGGLINLLSMFGWKGILVGLVLALALGGGGMCMGGQGMSCLGGGSPSSETRATSDKPVQSSPQEDELVHFVSYVFDDVQKTWTGKLEGYRPAKMVLFRRGVQTACGTASTAVGPFYCPNDQKVYIDLSFYDELRRRFGAPGDFAQAYVIAHELGHHMQNLTGQLGGGSRRANDQVPVELQADCLAGAWAQDADKRGLIEVGDIDEALNAASQIGDDTLQKKSQGYVQPESWTHGSAAQRSSSFKKGYQGGAAACGL